MNRLCDVTQPLFNMHQRNNKFTSIRLNLILLLQIHVVGF